jgi:arsenate reductase
MPNKIINVLFLCTGNSARSVMAEVLLNVRGAGRFRAFSAGSRPTGRVNPYTLKTLEAAGLPCGGLRSKSWDEFAQPDAPALDVVVTVCDSAAGESCPVWPGRPVRAHWSFPDPAAHNGGEDEAMALFRTVFDRIARRIDAVCALPAAALDPAALEKELARLAAD